MRKMGVQGGSMITILQAMAARFRYHRLRTATTRRTDHDFGSSLFCRTMHFANRRLDQPFAGFANLLVLMLLMSL